MDDAMMREELTRLGAPDRAPVVDSLYEPVASATRGVWRVRVDQNWSAVLKVLHPSLEDGHPMWRAGLEETHWYYWKREALALTSGVVQATPGLRMPVCLGAFERADGTVAVWLEDLCDAQPGSAWTVGRYEGAARAVGNWQGSYVAAGTLPRHAWMSHDWLRSYVARREPMMSEISNAAHLDAECKKAAVLLWANRAPMLAFLDTLPRTVCHFDLHPKNMFQHDHDIVLIDWAFVGIGALGEDPATLIGDAVFDFHVAPERLDELAEVVVDGYASGLNDAGIEIDLETLRLWIDIGTLVRNTWIFGEFDAHLAADRQMLNRRASADALPYWHGGLTWLANRSERALHAIGC